MPSPAAIKATTKVATIILVEGAAQMTKRKLTKGELESIGSALGWMILATNDTELDLLKAMEAEVSEVPTKSAAKSVMDEDPSPLMTAGKRYRRKKMRGGAPPMVAIILGAIATIFGANQGVQLYQLENHRAVIRTAALAQVARACPSELSLGPPPKPFVDWTGEYATALSDYNTAKAQCDAAISISATQIRAAEAAVDRAWQRLPAQIATVATAASVVATGPVTPATVTAAMSVGKAVHTLTSSFVAGSLPVGGTEFMDFVNTVAAGFPAAAAAAPSAAPSADAAAAPAGDGGVPAPADAAAAPAADAAAPSAAAAPVFAPPRRGAPAAAKAAEKSTEKAAASAAPAASAPPTWPKPPEGGRRKTKNRKSKRRVTRRKAPSMVKFAY